MKKYDRLILTIPVLVLLVLVWALMQGCTDALSEIRTVCDTCDYTTFRVAVNNGAIGDTIRLRKGSGARAAFVEVQSTNVKSKMLVESDMVDNTRDTIAFKQRDLTGITMGGDSVRIRNVVITYVDSTPVSSYNYLMSSGTTYGGHYFENVKFCSPSYSSNRRGIRPQRSGITSVTEPTVFKNCEWDSLFNGLYGSDYARTTATDVSLINCLFVKTMIVLGLRWSMDTCMVRCLGAGENIVTDSARGIKYKYLWGSATNTSNEFFTWDENSFFSDSNEFDHCVIDSSGHVGLVIDNWKSSKISNSIFFNASIYNHNNSYDSSLYNCQFKNVTIQSAWTNNNDATVDSTYNNKSSKFLILGTPTFAWYKSVKDTMDSLVTQNAITFSVTAGKNLVFIDTVKGVGKSYLLDTVYFPYHRHTSPYSYAGARKYLSNINDTNKTVNSFAVECSLALDFRHDSRMWADSFWTKNSWWTGDTARTYLAYGIDKESLTKTDSVDYRAGAESTLTVTSLTPNTYYWRTYTKGLSAGTTHLYDTTALDSFTIASSITCDSIRPLTSYYSQGGGIWKKLDWYGSGFGASQGNGFVHFGGASLGEVELWTDTHITDTIMPTDITRGKKFSYVKNNAGDSIICTDSVRIFRPYQR